ncbi:MAG: aldo/keto reductase [Erysipelotrichaceae bacterium]|nr:aldo/keto reductase [Erysipelotrichaceae bacterium]
MKQLSDIRKLGFGLMRLPQKNDRIDIEESKIMVDKFMEAGFNYFDTAFVYNGSEEAAKEILIDRYDRESFFLATKNAAWMKCESREDCVKQFETSLERTGAGYFDMYLLHNLGSPRTEKFDEFRMWDFVKEKKAEGLIRHYGFSFHGTPEELEVLLNEHPDVEFVQLQINYADWDNPAIRSRECYETCRRHNTPIVIMEPVKGGSLADPLPEIKELFKEAEPDISPSAWAIRYAASLEGVLTVLSGMSSIAQMEDNIRTMTAFKEFNDKDRETVKKAVEIMNKAGAIACTNCAYCTKVCPMNIGINEFFRAYNERFIYNNPAKGDKYYNRAIEAGKASASQCIQCASCEGACPQHLPIVELLAEKIVRNFE